MVSVRSSIKLVVLLIGCLFSLIVLSVPRDLYKLNSVFSASGGFDVNLTQAMDYDLWLRLHYVRKLELFDLKMDIACFDSAGESSKIIPLLMGNWSVRKKLSASYCVNVGYIENILFVTRIFFYWIYYKFKTLLFVNK